MATDPTKPLISDPPPIAASADPPLIKPEPYRPGDKPIDFMWRYVCRELDHVEISLRLRRQEEAAEGKTPNPTLKNVIKGLEADRWTLTKLMELLRRVDLNRQEVEAVFKTGVQ